MSKTLDLGAVTAYALAVKNGFTGTEAEWLASLKGADGVSPTAENIASALGYTPAKQADVDTLNQNLAGTGMQLKRWELSATSDSGGAVFITLPSGASATANNCSILSVVCKTAGYLAAVRPMLTPQGYWIFTLVDGSGAVKSSTAATFVIIAGIVGG